MTTNEALVALIEESQDTGSSDSEDVVRHIVEDGTPEEEAVFNIQQGVAMQDEGEGMVKRGKKVLSDCATLTLQAHTEGDLPKQFAFVSNGYTAWINTRPNGYSKLSPGMIKDLKEISPNVQDHIKVTTNISIKWGSIPSNKQDEVAVYLRGINKIVYGDKWEPCKEKPSLVDVKQESKAKTDSFYSHQFLLDDTNKKKFQKKMPIKFAMSSKNGREK